jgi:tetratricopeptide (TPR) repeat protein
MQLAQGGNRTAAEKTIQAIVHLPGEIDRLRGEELGLLERDAQLAPGNASIQGRVGLARYLAGWQKEADAALLTASLLEPRNAEHLFRLAVYYRDTGRAAKAKPIVERLLRLQPDNRMFQQIAAEMSQQ